MKKGHMNEKTRESDVHVAVPGSCSKEVGNLPRYNLMVSLTRYFFPFL